MLILFERFVASDIWLKRLNTMKHYSIRKFLLINLLVAITVTTLLTVIGNYYLDKKDIQEHVESLHPSHAIVYSFVPGTHIMDLSQHEESTHELGWRIVVDDLYIMLFTFPLSGFLIWMIIGKGFESLNRVTVEVANRAPTHLEPVKLEEVPEEIRPLVDELNRLFERLQDGFEREKRFAADAAHELKTPLAAIKAQAQVALHSDSLDEKNATLHKLIASVNRSTHIVQQLLTMSKLVPETWDQYPKQKIDIAKVARENLAMLAPLALEKNIELELEQNTKTVQIKGNLAALSILFRNLIDNAIRYSPKNSVIVVRMTQQKGQVIVEVCDQGPGIPNELHERVFERFFRVLGNQTTGSGLGLSIVDQICQMHHATVQLEKPQSGSGLVVKLVFQLD